MQSLSIIIPIYNVESYLSQCMDSVLVDNAFTGQVICVNDGSSDNSLSIIKQYAAKYPNIEIISQDNAGLSVARNVGLNTATGDYVFFLDGDDWITPGSVDIVLRLLKGEDVIYFNTKVFLQDRQCYRDTVDIPELSKINGPTYYATIIDKPRNISCVSVVDGFYARSFLVNNHLYFEPGLLHEDALFTPQVLLAAKKVRSINDIVYVYRVRENSIMSTMTAQNISDLLFIARQLYAKYERKGNVEDVFYQSLYTAYIDIIDVCYHLSIPLPRMWSLHDSCIMLRGATDDYKRKIAKLTFISPNLANGYKRNELYPFLRKMINRLI